MFPRVLSAHHPISRLRGEVESMFDDLFEDLPFAFRPTRSFPALNVWEEGDNFFAEAEVPGIKMDDLELLVIGNEITIKGERRDTQQEDATFHRRERGVGAFSRTLRLPADLDAGKVEAKLVDGVLTVTLPKAERAKARKIEIKALTK